MSHNVTKVGNEILFLENEICGTKICHEMSQTCVTKCVNKNISKNEIYGTKICHKISLLRISQKWVI